MSADRSMRVELVPEPVVARDGTKTVLVVDDEQMLREAVADALRDEGYVTLEGADGQEAVELFTREHPDLVLMDVMMPTLGGREAYALMRSARTGPPTPIVMMSAAVGPGLLDAAIAGYLAKPFDLDQLLELVAKLIGPPVPTEARPHTTRREP